MGKRRRAKKIKSYLSGNIYAQPIAPKESVVEKLVKAKKLYSKPLFAKKPAKRTKKESWDYGLKAIGSAAAVVGALLGGRKLVETIKGKVEAHRLEKFGEQGVGSSYKAKRFRKKFRKTNGNTKPMGIFGGKRKAKRIIDEYNNMIK
jgi:hypothetical protein